MGDGSSIRAFPQQLPVGKFGIPPVSGTGDRGFDSLQADKICGRCRETKPLSDFNKDRNRPGGVQSICRLCQRGADKKCYDTSTDRAASVRSNSRKARALAIEYLRTYLQGHPCVDCGEADIVVLDFDHVRGEKSYHVTRMASHGFSLAAIQLEIDKCEVRCANCHRRVTASRHGGWWRAQV